jgi:hypothetical protein
MSRFEYSKSILACVALAEEHSPRRTVVFHGYFISDGLEREALDGWDLALDGQAARQPTVASVFGTIVCSIFGIIGTTSAIRLLST